MKAASFVVALITFGVMFPLVACSRASCQDAPVPIIFDTDIGNDCDDVLALGMIHALQSRGECELLAVTITKDHPQAAAFTDAVNTFYGRGQVPIGVCDSGVTNHAGRFNVLADAKDDSGRLRFPHDLRDGKQAPDAVAVLRKALADAKDHSVVIAQVGFSTNLANLLDSPGDSISPMSGKELVRQKVSLVSAMAGAFTQIKNDKGQLYDHQEYNVKMDIPAAQKLASQWPTPIWWSGFEIGKALPYPHQSILNDYDYVDHHPLSEAYTLYIPPPHDRPTWDLTSVLAAIRPDHHYFDLSPPGTITVADDSLTTFKAQENGKHRYLIIPDGEADRITEALVLLSSQPPSVSPEPSR
ncbi:nucleoside hydrolase [Crateriforma conspicua]|uniref:nucleoside hydrolase n=1 Tax=Crateriforma conspicua TaxID=2527996 RepID=UPI00118BF92D|nr:nucleoside hydrolase [Crateriforma conspicua]QDV61016.1 Inosine-uridine preferring nucleoside hydrolase [Crateriforma conspicua]